MKKLLLITVALAFAASSVFAAEFSPTLLQLSADPVIQYDFDGSNLNIPVQVSGTDAGIILAVYTKDKSAEITPLTNGYLGWHYVNKVDTCLYFSPVKSVLKGATTVTWNGKDQDGGLVAAGEYTYYLWAFDNQGTKTLVLTHVFPTYRGGAQTFVEKDGDGLPMARPIYFTHANRWVIGNDPEDASLLETSNLGVASGWSRWAPTTIDRHDHSFHYALITNRDAGQASIHKWKWVPNGDAELQTDFGEDGFAELVANIHDSEPGVVTDGEYLYTADSNHHAVDADADFFIHDMDGFLVDQVDLTPWWSSPEDLEVGGQMNGGPNVMDLRNGYVFLNCHCSCLNQMVDPIRFLDSGDADDFYVWANANGDYVLDHNFEETAQLPWVCMDFNVGPYKYTIAADDNLFSIVNAYDVGAVTFGLFGPDGTGIGYMAVAGETAGWKRGSLFLDGGTAYDGLYLDNMQTGGSHYEWNADKADGKTYFLGHDSISGTITNAVAVDDDAPAAFSVAQNSPNPFNPTTTIGFNIAQAGDVSIDVFNVAGQKVDTLVNGYMEAGSHQAVWDASGFSAGVYFYTVKSGNFTKTMKMTLLK